MPMNKDFKRLVRARMAKTGEAYTAARAQLLKRSSGSGDAARDFGDGSPDTRPSPRETRPSDYAARAGFSDAVIQKRTGCGWDKWVYVLDKAGAADWSHRAIAEYVKKTYRVPDWWTQAVAVGYERIKGIREIGQRANGQYEATRSKTIEAPATTISRAFSDSRQRRKWLAEPGIVIRKAVAGKSVRMAWPDGTSVEVWLTTRGSKTVTAIAHRKLAGKDDLDRRRKFWGERLAALQALVQR